MERPRTPGVAFDVAFSSSTRWVGAAELDDVRYSVEIWPPELPWPLTFWFMLATKDDGNERWACVGYAFGAPVARDEVPTLPPAEAIELTPTQWRQLERNRYSYQRIAECLLVLDREGAAKVRSAMRRPRRTALNDNYLGHLAREYQARQSEPDLMYAMANERGIHRVTLRRQLEEADRRGMIPEGLLPRRENREVAPAAN
jgi:hypothetical protein